MMNNRKEKSSFYDNSNVFCIGGLDPSGGAGITADILSVRQFGVRAFSASTALTAQNAKGVLGVHSVDPDFFSLQVYSILKSMTVRGIKVGMVYSQEIFDVLLLVFREFSIPVVWDPVMDSSSGYSLMSTALRRRFKEAFPYISLLTPNIPEAEILTEKTLSSKEDMLCSAKILSDMGCESILIKGGHLKEGLCDLLYHKGKAIFFEKDKKELGRGVHGTGCALSSAITANIAIGFSLVEAVKISIEWLDGMLSDPQLLEEGGFLFLGTHKPSGKE